jgi:type IV secretory pathway TrbL component
VDEAGDVMSVLAVGLLVASLPAAVLVGLGCWAGLLRLAWRVVRASAAGTATVPA